MLRTDMESCNEGALREISGRLIMADILVQTGRQSKLGKKGIRVFSVQKDGYHAGFRYLTLHVCALSLPSKVPP